MPAGEFVREQLSDRHDVESFDCGAPSFNDWLQSHATQSIARGYSRVYVWHVRYRVFAFFTLSSYAISRQELARSRAHGEIREIPAILLGKLALDLTLQGQGLMPVLLADAVHEAVRASSIAGARYQVVDAGDDALMARYEQYGFGQTPPTAEHPRRLISRIADLRAAIEN